MGTCFSKKGSSTNTIKKKRNLKLQDPAPVAPPPSLSPPPLPEEEAVVKEVLTETPLPSSATTRSNSRRVPEDPTAKSPGKGVEAAAVAAAAPADDDGSEDASEIYSPSECFSVSTALTEKRSVGGEEADAGEEETSAPPKWWPPEWSSPAGKVYQQHQRRRSTPGESPARRDPRAGAGGGARSSPSPARRTEGRPFPVNGNASAGMWKGHGERSGRRSVSPAAKRVADARAAGRGGVSRSSSMRKTATASPRRPRPAGATAGSGVRMGAEAAAGAGKGGDEALLPSSPGPKESVENPLVSLECFIFL